MPQRLNTRHLPVMRWVTPLRSVKVFRAFTAGYGSAFHRLRFRICRCRAGDGGGGAAAGGVVVVQGVGAGAARVIHRPAAHSGQIMWVPAVA